MRSSRLYMSISALLIASTSGAQAIPYDRTVLLPGFKEQVRWISYGAASNLDATMLLGIGSARYSTPYSYHPKASVAEQSADYLTYQASSFGDHNVLVGHSMGGIIARNLLINTDPSVNLSSRIYGIVTVNSPHYGAPIVESANQIDWRGSSLIWGFIETAISSYLFPVISWIGIAARSVFNVLADLVFNNLKMFVGNVLAANAPGALDLVTTSPTIIRNFTTLDAKPHATVNGILPKKDASLRLIASSQGWNANYLIAAKYTALGITAGCRRIGWSVLWKFALGSACGKTQRLLLSLDDDWSNWTHGPLKTTPSDGYFPADYSRYPGTQINDPTNLYAFGTDHFSTVTSSSGRDRIRDGLAQIGVQRR